MAFSYDPNKYDFLSQEVESQATDPGYSNASDLQTLSRDPRFIQDLRDQYGPYLSREELIDRFFQDKVNGTFNTLSAIGDAAEAISATPEEKARLNRLQSAYNQLPNPWEEGGRGMLEAGKDVAQAILTDPVNLIPVASAGAKGLTAARGASALGKNALGAGMRAGAKTGAITEGAIGAGQEAVVNTANQIRDVQVGLRDEFSTGEAALATAAGGTVGAAVGGVLGAGAGALASRTGVRQADAGRYYQLTPETIASMSPDEASRLLAQAEAGFDAPDAGPQIPEQTRQERQQATTEPEAEPDPNADLSPLERQIQGLEPWVRAHVEVERQNVIDAKADGLDPEDIADAEARLDAITRLEGLFDRVKRINEEIRTLGETNDVGARMKRDRRRRDLERDLTDLLALVGRSDTIADPADLGRQVDDLQGRMDAEAPEPEAAGPDAPETPPAAGTDTPDAPQGGPRPDAPTEPDAPAGGAAPTEPAAPDAPNADAPTDATPFRKYASPNQAEAIRKILADAGMSEADLQTLVDRGVLSVTPKKGVLTRKATRELRNYIDEVNAGQATPPRPRADAPESDADTPETTVGGDQNVPAGGEVNAGPLTYQTEKLREETTRALSAAGKSEADLMAMINEGRVTTGKRGQMIASSLRQLRAALEVDQGSAGLRAAMGRPAAETPDAAPATPDTPATPDAAPKPEGLSGYMRGQALAAGVDYRDIVNQAGPTAQKRAINKAVSEAIKGKQGAPDDYAYQVNEELNTLTDLLDAVQLTPEERAMALRVLAGDRDNIKSDPEDLIALFDFDQKKEIEFTMDSRSELIPDPNTDGFNLTETQVKKYKRAFRQLIKQQYTLNEAVAMARLKALADTSTGPAPEIRNTGRRTAEAANLTTAGKTNEGRTQGFLRPGTRIARGSDYTITDGRFPFKGDFAFEEAVLKAQSKGSANIQPFILSGRMKVHTPNGVETWEKGKVAFAHYNGQAYSDMDFAMFVNGDITREKLITPPAGPQAPVPSQAADDALNALVGNLTDPAYLREQTMAYVQEGNAAGLLAFLKAARNLRDGNRGASAPAPTKPKPVKPQGQTAPETNTPNTQPDSGDLLLIVRRKDKPEDVRMMSPKQAAAGKDINAIIGKSDPDAWEVRYAPANRWSSNKGKLRTLFDELPPDDGSGAAPNYKNIGRPLTTEEASVQPITDLSDAEKQTVLRAEPRLKRYLESGDFTPNHLFMAIVSLEDTRWPADKAGYAKVVSDLRALYEALDRNVPMGLAPVGVSRKESIEGLKAALSAAPSREIEIAAELLRKLGGDPDVAPEIRAMTSSGAETQIKGEMRTSINRGKIESSVALNSAALTEKKNLTPASFTVTHEVGHWAYLNILTPKDRLEFWRMVEQYYVGGKLSRDKINEGLAKIPGAKTWGNRKINSNGGESPQELFANLFEIYVTRRQDMPAELRDEGFWLRMAQYVKAIFDRYVHGAKIPPEIEPLFAKILPPDERAKFRNGVDAEATTPAGKHYDKRYSELLYLRSEMEDAIERDSADGIINAGREVVRYLLSVAPRGSKPDAPNSGVLAPLKKIGGYIHQRIDDIDEIIAGRPFEYDPANPRGPSILEQGMQEVEDPLAVADLLRDFYTNGYAGRFQPAKRDISRIKRLDKTSISSILDDVQSRLESAYKRAESTTNLPPSARPKLTETPAQPSSAPNQVQRRATQSRKRSTEKRATEIVDGVKNNKPAAPPKTPTTGAGANSAKATMDDQGMSGLSDQVLIYLHDNDPDQATRNAAGLELARRKNAGMSQAEREAKITEEMQMYLSASGNGAESRAFLVKLYEDEKDPVSKEAILRALNILDEGHVNNSATRNLDLTDDDDLFDYTLESVSSLVDRELADSVGQPTVADIPPAARANVRELLSHITHRDPWSQYVARTMTYRMLNLLNKTTHGAMGEANVLSASDVARLAGRPGEGGTAVFADLRGPEFQALRKDLRRLSVGFNKGNTSPFDLVHEVAHVIARSGMMDSADMDSVFEAYRLADDGIKDRVAKTYGKKYANQGLRDRELERAMAEEWFAESMVEYLAGRVAKGDLTKAMVNNDVSNLTLRSGLSRAIDNGRDYLAYLVNGLVGRNDIQQQFRRLFVYGDMRARPQPLNPARRTGMMAFAPRLAADMVDDHMSSLGKTQRQKLEDFVAGGLSMRDGQVVAWYHSTPVGRAFDAQGNPDVVLEPSRRGYYGPGQYLSDNPEVGEEVYSRRPTPESQMRQLEAQNLPEAEYNARVEDIQTLGVVRRKMSEYRRAYSRAAMGRDFVQFNDRPRDELRALIEEFALAEVDLVKRLESAGVTTDPLVMPILVRAKRPFDFRMGTLYEEGTETPEVAEILRRYNGLYGITSPLLYDPRPMDGFNLYNLLIDHLHNREMHTLSRPEAQTRLNRVLQDLGYDSLLGTHTNSLNRPGGERVPGTADGPEGYTYETAVRRYDGLIVFDPRDTKHLMAREFDEADPRLYYRATEVAPPGLAGDLAMDLIEEPSVTMNSVSSLGEAAEHRGATPQGSQTLLSMLRQRDLTPQEETVLRKSNPSWFLQSQSERHHRLGAHWLGRYHSEIYRDVHQRFAKRYMPIHRALRALPDADGKIRSWARESTGSVMQDQPKSYQRIVRALRHGKDSRQYQALNAQEKAIWTQIRASLSEERQALLDRGIHVGDRGPNYLPQVWDKEKIRKNRDDFLAKMSRYYKVEKTANNVLASDEEAMAFAEGIFDTLAGDQADGVFVPIKGGSRNPNADSVQFSRLIELEKYPESLKDLEGYLEADLEALLVKYFEGTQRRLAHADRLGLNSHGLYDYLEVAEQGAEGIKRLLTRGKVFTNDLRMKNAMAQPTEVTLTERVRMPFEGREGEVDGFVQSLIQTHRERGSEAARAQLMSVAPQPAEGVPLTYMRRVDAIVGALDDFKGQKAEFGIDDYQFMEAALAVSMHKPVPGSGSRGVMAFSKTLRSVNNLTLLSYTMLTSLGDLALPVIRSGSFSSWAKGLGKVMADPDYRKAIVDAGVAMENIVHHRMVHMYGAPDNKLQTAFFNATMLTPWTDMNRTIAGAVGYESFKAMQAKAVRTYQPGKALKDQTGAYKTAHRYLTQFDLGDYLPTGSKAGQSLEDVRVMEDDPKVRMAMVQMANESIFAPNADDVPLWAQTPFGALIFQLKSFPLMMTRLTGQVIREAKRGNVKPLLYFATLGPGLGAGALAVKDYAQQRGGEDERSAALRERSYEKIAESLGYEASLHGPIDTFIGWYVESFIQMGGLGLIGDIIHSTAAQLDNGSYGETRITSTLLGPSYGLAAGGVRVMAGITDGNESNAKERTAAREIAQRIPFLGGNRNAREAITDALAGYADEGGGWNYEAWRANR